MTDAISDTIFVKAVPGEKIIDLNYALQHVAEQLPGWCWRIGTCCVSDDAWLAPDMNCPTHGARLKAELMPVVMRVLNSNKEGDGYPIRSIFDAGVDIDRRPPGNIGQAVLDALRVALDALEDLAESKEDEWMKKGEEWAESFAKAEVEFFAELDEGRAIDAPSRALTEEEEAAMYKMVRFTNDDDRTSSQHVDEGGE